LVISFAACQQPGGESTGSEYMPDMAHSVAYEANTYNYYYNNTWGSEEEYYKYAQPRKSVPGTVARNAAGSATYAYGDTEEERTRAGNELVNNPYKITEAGLATGKELYNINCGICHGEKGDGNGYLVRDDGGVYPVQPAIFTSDEFVAASNGRYYHSIMHGKNLMGAYADKLNYEERWQVIHYIRSLQAKDRKLVYTHLENTLNAVDQPGGEVVQVAEVIESHDSHDHHGADHHGAEHHDAGHHGADHHGVDHHGEKHDETGKHDHHGEEHKGVKHHDGNLHEGDETGEPPHELGADAHLHNEGHGMEGHEHEGHDHKDHDQKKHDNHNH